MSTAAQKSPESSQAAARRKPAQEREAEGGIGREGGAAEALLALQQSAGNRAVAELLRGSSGRPLDRRTRREMEAKFGADFSDVRVHAGEIGGQVALGAGARAVTSGRNIAFTEGFYAPARSEGKRLIAHELAHVIQQGRPGGRTVSKGGAEAEARQAGAAVAGGKTATVATSASGVQADPLTEEEKRRKNTEAMLPQGVLNSLITYTTPQPDSQPRDAAAPTLPPPMLTNEDFANAIKNGPPQDPNKVHWLGGQPSWTIGMTYKHDAQGNTTVSTPELGETKFSPSGKRLTPVPSGDAQKIQQVMRAQAYLAQTGGKRIVDGKALDEAGWKQHIEGRKQTLGEDVERKFTNLSEGERLFHDTQTGWALPAAGPAHLLGGRGWNDSKKIVRDTRQDIEIAKHMMDKAQTPVELAEAEQHLQFAMHHGESNFTGYKEDIYAGAKNTITGIKITAGAAVTVAGLGTPALVAGGGTLTLGAVGGGAAFGGGLNAAHQIAEIHDKTRKDFSFGEVVEGTVGGAVGGGAMVFVPELAAPMLGMGVANSADEFGHGHYAAGGLDALAVMAPLAKATLSQPGTRQAIGNYLRPRAGAIAMRVGQGLENAGVGGNSLTGSIPNEVPTMTQGSVNEQIVTPQPGSSTPVVAGKPGAFGAASAEGTPTVDPVPTVGEGTAAKPANFDPAPANVGDKAFQARRALTIQNAMRANRRNTIGAGGEASHLTSGAVTGMDLNAVSANHPQIDLSSRETFTSVKNFSVDKPLNQATMKRYDKELRALRTPEEPGISTKLGDAANRLANNREAIQATGSWPKGLAKNATPEQIAKFINRQGAVGIPADHVEPTRAYIAERARANPEAYGLKPGPGLEKGINRLVQRVQPNGLTSEEYMEINKKAAGP